MIDKNKKYRLANGSPYVMLDIHEGVVFGRVLCGNLWGSIQHNASTGKSSFHDPMYSLVEITPYEDWKIDDRVWVWSNDHPRQRRHFAGISEDERPLVFKFGKSSWTTPGIPIVEPLEEWEFAEKCGGEG